MGRSAPDIRQILLAMRSKLGALGLSERVEKAWLFWARGLLQLDPARAPESLSAQDVSRYVKLMTEQKKSGVSAQRQITRACVFLLIDVLGCTDPELRILLTSDRAARKPTILSPGQVQELLDQMSGPTLLMASLSYGAGLRLMECVRLRVRDLNGNRIVVLDSSGRVSRETILPERAREPMRAHIEQLKAQHIRELADGFGGVKLPRIARAPSSARRSWSWQFLFPGPYMSDPNDGESRAFRDHMSVTEIRQAIEQAARMAGIEQPVSENTLRNSFAAHLLRRGLALCDVEKLLGVSPGNRKNGTQHGEGSQGSDQSTTTESVAG